MSNNKEIIRMFEDEFKNKANVDIVYDLMADNFVHHAPIPGVGEAQRRVCNK